MVQRLLCMLQPLMWGYVTMQHQFRVIVETILYSHSSAKELLDNLFSSSCWLTDHFLGDVITHQRPDMHKTIVNQANLFKGLHSSWNSTLNTHRLFRSPVSKSPDTSSRPQPDRWHLHFLPLAPFARSLLASLDMTSSTPCPIIGCV